MSDFENEPVDDYEDDYYDPAQAASETTATVSGWGVSIGLHAIVFLLLGLIVVVGQLIEDSPPVRSAELMPSPPPPEPTVDTVVIDSPDVVVEVDEVVEEIQPMENFEVEEITETEDEIEAEVPEPKGRTDTKSVSEQGGANFWTPIGSGSSGGGPFGSQRGGGKKRALGKHGGPTGAISSVNKALLWFQRHQSPNGMWDVDGYVANCALAGPKCEPGAGHTGADGDAASTGYAVLCYLGAGYTHRAPGRFRKTVSAGIQWLVDNQNADGSFGKGRNYENGVCTMALAEAYAMTTDHNLREAVQKGVDHIIGNQLQTGGEGYGGLGWDYTKAKETRVDSSVSGWCVMALKAAKVGGIDIGSSMDGARNWVQRAWEATNQGVDMSDPYTAKGGFPYTWNPQTDKISKPDRTSIGLCVSVFLGEDPHEIKLNSMANWVAAEHQPKWQRFEDINQYYFYYDTLGVFMAGGDRWTKWNDQFAQIVLDSQRKSDDCFDGSWDYKTAGNKYHGVETGRLLSTAYMCLSMQVYWRFIPLEGHKPR